MQRLRELRTAEQLKERRDIVTRHRPDLWGKLPEKLPRERRPDRQFRIVRFIDARLRKLGQGAAPSGAH